MVGKDEENRLLKTCGIGREGVEYRYDRKGKFDISSGMVFDFGDIVKPRIEVNWKKKKGK